MGVGVGVGVGYFVGFRVWGCRVLGFGFGVRGAWSNISSIPYSGFLKYSYIIIYQKMPIALFWSPGFSEGYRDWQGLHN